jgi:hypothetical protein
MATVIATLQSGGIGGVSMARARWEALISDLESCMVWRIEALISDLESCRVWGIGEDESDASGPLVSD